MLTAIVDRAHRDDGGRDSHLPQRIDGLFNKAAAYVVLQRRKKGSQRQDVELGCSHGMWNRFVFINININSRIGGLGVHSRFSARARTSFSTNASNCDTCFSQLKSCARRRPLLGKSRASSEDSKIRNTRSANSSGENRGKYNAAVPHISRCTAKSDATTGRPLDIASTRGWANDSA